MSKNAQIRENLEKAYTQLHSAHSRIQNALEKDASLCANASNYGGVTDELENARELLDRKTYRVAVAGMMSAGKSTLTNSLLESPGLLPTGNEETTLTITVIRKPEGRPGISITYLTRDEAVRGIFERGSYVDELKKLYVERDSLDEGEAGRKLKELQRAGTDDQLAEIDRLTTEEKLAPELRTQLKSFVQALDDYSKVLGTTVFRDLRDKRKLLASAGDEAMGHLLLIAQGILYVEAQLLSKAGIEFVDLPGADSTNDRQQRIAYDFLKETDLLLSITTSSGFRKIDERLLEQFTQARGNIRNRVFFVANRFDDTRLSDLPDKERSLNFLKSGFIDYVERGFDARNLFFTASLWESLDLRMNRGEDLREKASDFDSVKQGCISLVKHLDDQGTLGAIKSSWSDRYAADIVEHLRALGRNGAVPDLRKRLVEYLGDRMEFERLREIHDSLKIAQRKVADLLDPERDKVAGVLDTAREQLQATGAYLEKVAYDTQTALRGVYKGLAKHENGQDEFEFVQLMNQIGNFFQKNVIQTKLNGNNKDVDFDEAAAGGDAAQTVMRTIIDQTRKVLAREFVTVIADNLTPEFAKMYTGSLVSLENEDILHQLGGVLGRPELRDRYAERLQQMVDQLKLVSRTRAMEETWIALREKFNPNPGPKPFREIEDEFRQALIAEMNSVWDARMKSLRDVLLKYHKVVIEDFITDFNAMMIEDVLVTAKQTAASLPAELLFKKADPEERRRYAVAELVNAADAATEALSGATTLI